MSTAQRKSRRARERRPQPTDLPKAVEPQGKPCCLHCKHEADVVHSVACPWCR